ncbi:MAG: thioredoxin domain-containing protein, partial [Nitrososphaeraceae archaeon]
QPLLENASALGDSKAKIILIEFSDYDCHNCSQFHNETSREIINDYINLGIIKFLFKDFTISDIANKTSTLAAKASNCSEDEGKYWQYHDELYNNSHGSNKLEIKP